MVRTPRGASRLTSAAAALALVTAAGTAHAQDEAAPAATTPAELLDALRAAGVEIPDGFTTQDDGTVALPAQPASAAAAAAAPAAAAAAEEDPAAPLTERDKWTFKITASLRLTDGNTETTTVRADASAIRNTDNDRLSLGAGGFYATDEGEETANELFASSLYDRFFGPRRRWLAFAEGRYEYDEFESFLHRLSVVAGPGYRAINTDKFELILRAGLGARRDFGGMADNTIVPEALAGADFAWDISERQDLVASTRYFPSLLDTRDYRIVSSAEYSILMADFAEGLSFNVGIEHEYEQQVPEEVDESDIRLYAGLGLEF